MTDYNLHQAKLLAGKLSPVERAQLVTHCKALGLTVRPDNLDKDWLLPAVEAAMRKRGVLNWSATFKVAENSPHYLEHSEPVRTALLEALGEEFQVTHLVTMQLGEVAIGALLTHIENFPDFTGFSVKKVLNCVHLIPQAIDHQLPGYLANGMLPMVLARKLGELDEQQ